MVYLCHADNAHKRFAVRNAKVRLVYQFMDQ